MEASEDVEIVSIPPKTDQCPDDPEAMAACQKAQALASALLELNAQISVVKGARIDYQDDKETLQNLERLFEKANSDLIARHGARYDVLLKEEGRLRELTLAAYALDPTCKKPAPGVGVRLVSKLEYDCEKALDWAVEEAPAMLDLDVKSFEAYALQRLKKEKTVGNLQITLIETPQATISKELGGT
jgi:hypothetical protein